MSAHVLPWLTFVLLLLMGASGVFGIVQLIIAGMQIMSAKASRREEAIGRIKWIVLGIVVALSTYYLAHIVGYEALISSPSATTVGTAPTLTFGQQPIESLPGAPQASGVGGWAEAVAFMSISDLLNMFALVFWALSGFTGPTAMAKANIQTSTNADVMGIFSPHTWSAMMYVQHSLYFIIGVAALISFVIQGIQIQNAPSSGVAKERAVALIKSVVLTGFMLGTSPYLLGLINAGVSDLTQYIMQLSMVHDQQLANANPTLRLLFASTPLRASLFKNLQLFSGVSVANALFNLAFSIVNLTMWFVFQFRRIMLGILITMMPLFYIGLVTGRKPDIAVHWWKEITAFLLIPFVSSIFLLMAQVFIGV